MSPRPPSSYHPWQPPRRIREKQILFGSDLDGERREREKDLQHRALQGDRQAKAELVAMGLKLWRRNGKTIVCVKEAD
jgi:hypothetical protein